MSIETSSEPAKHKLRGRLPGVRNKATKSVKDSWLEAFQLVGGAEELARWAKTRHKVKGQWVYPNLESFFTLAIKLVPTESVQSGTVNHGHYIAREIAVEHREALPAADNSISPASVQPVEDAVEVIDFIG